MFTPYVCVRGYVIKVAEVEHRHLRKIDYTACLQQEIVVPRATANIMAPHVVPKQKSKQKHSFAIAIF
jgi:hypothetical protein